MNVRLPAFGKTVVMKTIANYGLAGAGLLLAIALLTGYMKSPITEAASEHGSMSKNQDDMKGHLITIVKINRAICLNMADTKEEIQNCNQ